MWCYFWPKGRDNLIKRHFIYFIYRLRTLRLLIAKWSWQRPTAPFAPLPNAEFGMEIDNLNGIVCESAVDCLPGSAFNVFILYFIMFISLLWLNWMPMIDTVRCTALSPRLRRRLCRWIRFRFWIWVNIVAFPSTLSCWLPTNQLCGIFLLI